MQHYGMPTRLLDWTESSLTALFFAVEPHDVDIDAAVWILGPATLNKATSEQRRGRVPMSNHETFQRYTLDVDASRLDRRVAAEYPMAVRPCRSTTRVVAQRGMFTIHGRKQVSIDRIRDEEDEDEDEKDKEFDAIRLQKLVVSGDCKPRLKKELLLAGVCYSSLFPDLDGLSKEIAFRYSRGYMDEYTVL